MPNPAAALTGRLESAVTQELSQAGIQDADVLTIKRQEKGLGPFTWVEIQRTVAAGIDRQKRVEANLHRVAKKNGLIWKIDLESNGAATDPTVTLKKFFIPLQKIYWKSPRVVAPITKQPLMKKPARAPRLAIVIDDVGYSVSLMDHYAGLEVPLTFAILPGDKRAKVLSNKATQLGFPVILHMPLQPTDVEHNNPGYAGLFMNMTEEAMQQRFEKNVANVPDLVGMNNHMGSAFTENEEMMARLLTWVKAKNLFFLDSRTSSRSVVTKVAKRLGVPYLINQTFLDNVDEQAEIEAQLDKAMSLAIRYKNSVAIGHYRRKHLLEALRVKIPEFKAKGIELVGLPDLLKK